MMLTLGLLINLIAAACLGLAIVGASNRRAEDAQIVALVGIGLAIIGSGLVNG